MTNFPVDQPAFTTSGMSLFPSVDDFDLLEGGQSPMYGAMSALLDFAAAQTSTNERKTLVVVSASTDDTCGSVAECLDARNAVIERARSFGVALVMIDVKDASSPKAADFSELAEGSGGAAFWIDDVGQLGG